MPEVLDWQRTDPHDILRRAVPLLAEGRIVVFPTETDYQAVASALALRARMPTTFPLWMGMKYKSWISVAPFT